MERYCCCQWPENLPTLESVAKGAGDEEDGEVDVGGDDADQVDDQPGEQEQSLRLSQPNQGSDVQGQKDEETRQFDEQIHQDHGAGNIKMANFLDVSHPSFPSFSVLFNVTFIFGRLSHRLFENVSPLCDLR